MNKKKIFYYVLIAFLLYASGCLGWFFYSTSEGTGKKQSKIGPSASDFASSSTRTVSISTPEELMDQYVKAYRRNDTTVLLTLISDEWIKKHRTTRSELNKQMGAELAALEKKFGPVIGWELPRFDVYGNVAIVKSKIKRKSGFSGQATFILIKRDKNWRILEIVGG
jgi:hypothetical protein